MRLRRPTNPRSVLTRLGWSMTLVMLGVLCLGHTRTPRFYVNLSIDAAPPTLVASRDYLHSTFERFGAIISPPGESDADSIASGAVYRVPVYRLEWVTLQIGTAHQPDRGMVRLLELPSRRVLSSEALSFPIDAGPSAIRSGTIMTIANFSRAMRAPRTGSTP